jgi:UDP-N-acetylmuramoylalanine--D-glutamate ligase
MQTGPMSTRTPIRARADLAGRRAVVLGLARSGTALARFLADAGARVTVYDRRGREALSDAIASLAGRPIELELGSPPDAVRHLLADAEMVVTSPSISPRFPTTDDWLREALLAVESRGGELISEVELFLRLTSARVMAVTGTKGKTTTTALIGAMLQAGGVRHEVGGNIGRPLVELSSTLTADDWALLELSELQLPTISRGADVAVYTNIGADHLDRHGSVEAYRGVKARLAELSADGVVILNADDPGCRDLAARLTGETRWYGLDDPGRDATVHDGWLQLAGERVLQAAEVPLPGRHMLANTVAAALGASLAGASHEAIADAIRGFGGVPHRLETVAEHGGIRFVNDSQATIPVAAIAALDAFAPASVVIIAGGSDKGLDYDAFAEAMAGRCRAAVLIGETSDRLERLIADRLPVERCASMDEAVAAATRRARAGDVVLLAPAAASFDMFEDYAARGDAFRAAVLARVGGR